MLTGDFLAGTSRETSLQVPRFWSFTLDFRRCGFESLFVFVSRVPKMSVSGRHRVPDHSEVIPRQP